MTITNAAELRETYLHVFDSFATTPTEVAAEVDGVNNVRFARELLGTLVTAGLVAEGEGDEGAVWQTYPDTYDSINRDEAERLIDTFLNTASKENTMSTATKTRPAPKAKDEGFHPCYCGCGDNVPSKSFYRPGHDARHAGVVGRKVAETGDTDLYSDLPSDRLVQKAQGIASKAKEKADAKAQRAAEREAKKNAPQVVEGTIKIGKRAGVKARQFDTGEVEYWDEKMEGWDVPSKTSAASFVPNS